MRFSTQRRNKSIRPFWPRKESTPASRRPISDSNLKRPPPSRSHPDCTNVSSAFQPQRPHRSDEKGKRTHGIYCILYSSSMTCLISSGSWPETLMAYIPGT